MITRLWRGWTAQNNAEACEDYETPVLEPRALELLSRYEELALHFETSSFAAD